MSHNIDTMRVKIEVMSGDVAKISNQMAYMENLQTMNQRMGERNVALHVMTANTDSMRWNMQSISRPMSMMNNFTPW